MCAGRLGTLRGRPAGEGLTRRGVTAERIYVDRGLTGTNRERPGLREAVAACRSGDTWW
jgi:DNA invertase Pin-like site-specific DNA recombinase